MKKTFKKYKKKKDKFKKQTKIIKTTIKINTLSNNLLMQIKVKNLQKYKK